ncbi:hypothetical protein DFH28DRAFT_433779 [Melampsora americana]|nr:hypothetical protein DFH28DRAFT_433779 [Melampsora americana]
MFSTSPFELIVAPCFFVILSILPFFSNFRWPQKLRFTNSSPRPQSFDQAVPLPASTSSSNFLQVQSANTVVDGAVQIKAQTLRLVSHCEDGHLINQVQFWRRVKLSKIATGSLMGILIVLRCFELGWDLVNPQSDQLSQTGRVLEDVMVIIFWSITCYVVFNRSVPITEVAAHWTSVIHLSTLTVTYCAWSLCCLLLPTSDINQPNTGSSNTHRWLSSIDAVVSLVVSVITCTIPRSPRILYRSPYDVEVKSHDLTPPEVTSCQSSGHENTEDLATTISQENKNNINKDGNVTLIACCSVLDHLFFNWVSPVMKAGMKKASLEKSDLPHLSADFRSWNLYKKVIDNIAQASQNQTGLMKHVGKSPQWMNPLLWRVIKINQTAFMTQAALALLNSVLYYAPAFFLRKIIEFLEHKDASETKSTAMGYTYCAGLLIAMLSESIVSGQLWYISNSVLCARVRIQLNTAIYAKTLRRKDITAVSSPSDSALKNLPGEEALANLTSASDTSAVVESSSARVDTSQMAGDTTLKKKKESLKSDPVGFGSKSQVLNLFTIDADRVADFGMSCFSLIDAPAEVLIGTIFLYDLLGIASIVGITISILFIPLNHYTSKWYAMVQDKLMMARDRRVSLMNEVLGSIRMIKYMAWEKPFEEKILRSRDHELSQLRQNFLLEISFNFIWLASPIFCVLVSFLWYTKVSGNELTPAVAFTSLAVFAELKFALNTLPETFIDALQCLVSLHRIENYLASPECETDTEALTKPLEASKSHLPLKKPRPSASSVEGPNLTCIAIRSATITWPTANPADQARAGSEPLSPMTPSRRRFYLEDITIDFPSKQLTLICGSLGSGKTLLLLALLGEADLLAGQIICPRSPPDTIHYLTHLEMITEEEWLLPTMAYAPQSAWLQNANVRTNILFGLPYVKKRYEATLNACSLVSDLLILEDGDQTEIGEKGVNLSGGQKARISLARAVYSRASVILLDDVLSAVDAHTARHIVDHCFKGPLLKDRTIILVSHHVQLCAPIAAYVVCLENGNVDLATNGDDFLSSKKYKTLSGIDAADDEENVVSNKPSPALGSTKPKEPSKLTKRLFRNVAANDVPQFNDNSPAESAASSVDGDSDSESETDSLNKPARKFIEDETRAVGHVDASVFKMYLSANADGLAGTLIFWTSFVAVFLGNKIMDVAETYVLNLWSNSNDQAPKPTKTIFSLAFHETNSVDFYLGLYTAVTLLNVVVSTVRWLVLYNGALRASQRLYKSTLRAVLCSPLRFFDTVPLGRLLNRFGKDFEGIDSSLPDNLGRSLMYGLNVATTIVSIAFVTPTFLIPFAIISILYWWYGRQYTQIARELRRLDSVTKSPLFSAYGETVAGVAVIRAFGGCSRALALVFERIDTNVSFYFYLWSVNRWLSIRFALLSSFVVGLTGFLLIRSRDSISASLAGFALTFAINISGDMILLVRRFTALEMSMVAVERVKEFSEMDAEAPEIMEPRPPANWPHSGEIEVKELTVRYSPTLPDVLHSVTFHVPARGKVGIVGATGCGKSTLAQSFFRFVEAWDGYIKIDGLDIKNIGLFDLRSRLTIIPQDPTILSGSLRSTLDVFDEHADAEIYSVLRRVNLIPATDADSDGLNENVFRNLDTEVSEQGSNFSQGQRQLLCMARALLKRSKVLLMDEATSSIDNESDAHISLTIQQEFSESTLLVIAHRLRTVINFDAVLVLDQGRVIEYDSPAKLIANPKSRFHTLCRAAGKREFRALKRMAGSDSTSPKEVASTD